MKSRDHQPRCEEVGTHYLSKLTGIYKRHGVGNTYRYLIKVMKHTQSLIHTLKHKTKLSSGRLPLPARNYITNKKFAQLTIDTGRTVARHR